jgi:hypothetical protein
MIERKFLITIFILFVLVIIVSGCFPQAEIKKMQEIQIHESTLIPQDGKALIVFFRPVDGIYRINASVLRKMGKEDPELVGILASGTWLTYSVDPGKHLFMSAAFRYKSEFMSANLLPNKTYYVLLKVKRFGFLRFYLNPVHRDVSVPDEPQEALKDLRLVKKTRESENWARDNMPNLRERMASYEQARSHLRENDGW